MAIFQEGEEVSFIKILHRRLIKSEYWYVKNVLTPPCIQLTDGCIKRHRFGVNC